MKLLLSLLGFIFLSPNALAVSLKSELTAREKQKSECIYNKKYHIHGYKVSCENNYHHYNYGAVKKFYKRSDAISKNEIKISEFNALHPGMDKTRFKDFDLVAKMINNFDIIGVTELIGLTDRDKKLINFIKEAPQRILKESKKLAKIVISRRTSASLKRKRLRERKILIQKIKQLEDDTITAQNNLHKPGYLKILDALHKLPDGEQWALVLSPRGEGSTTTPVMELVGYYYRSSVVKPKINQYCKSIRKYGKSSPYACIINMDAQDFDEDKRGAFARRPFMAEFISGRFSFSLITSHVIFDSPQKPVDIARISNAAFGVDNYNDIGAGATKKKYARFAEIKITLDFISKLLRDSKRYKQKDIIFMGDFNLESENKYWETALQSWPGSQLFIDAKTSLSESKYDGKTHQETKGGSSNYDHFIFDPTETDECFDTQTQSIRGGVYNFTQSPYNRGIDRRYRVRTNRKKTNVKYIRNRSRFYEVYRNNVNPYRDGTKTIYTVGKKELPFGRNTIKSYGVIKDQEAHDQYITYFLERILESQLKEESYYGYTKQIISDHFPIYMSCRTN